MGLFGGGNQSSTSNQYDNRTSFANNGAAVTAEAGSNITINDASTGLTQDALRVAQSGLGQLSGIVSGVTAANARELQAGFDAVERMSEEDSYRFDSLLGGTNNLLSEIGRAHDANNDLAYDLQDRALDSVELTTNNAFDLVDNSMADSRALTSDLLDGGLEALREIGERQETATSSILQETRSESERTGQQIVSSLTKLGIAGAVVFGIVLVSKSK